MKLNGLVGGQHLLIPITLAHNGLAIDNKDVLFDTGAGVYALMRTDVAKNLREKTGAKRMKLRRPAVLKGYDGGAPQEITHATVCHLTVDGRRQQNVPFLEVPKLTHEVLIGRLWLAEQDVDISARHRCLKWPENHRRSPPSKDLKIKYPRGRPIDPRQQQDANRRDRLMAVDEKRRQAGRRPVILKRGATWEDDSTGKMDRALKGQSAPPPAPRKRPDQTRPSLEVNFLGAHEWHYGEEKTTLAEINEIAEARHEAEDPSYEKALKERLPAAYRDFKDVFSKKQSDTLPPPRDCDHQIKLTEDKKALGGRGPLYHMPLEKLDLLRDTLHEHLNRGFIVPSKAAYTSPVLFAPKPNGGWRFCVDYRKLNRITEKDKYPSPLIDETFRRITGAKVFTKLDIRHAFHRIRMHPDSEALTAFGTRYGAYQYKVMPFGLCNGPATFQRFINSALEGLLDVTCTAYADDILVYSEDPRQHEQHVKEVLARLRAAGLQVDIAKSEFSVRETKFLGFIISTQGMRMDPEKVKTILNWRPPRNVKGIRSFLGLVNYFRRFIRNHGHLRKPLVRLTRLGVPFAFGTEEIKAFEALKAAVAEEPVLRNWRPELPTRVETDASNGITGGVLSQQQPDGEWHPVAYYTKTMCPSEMNYGIESKELLAVINALNEWRAELICLPEFEVITDQQALKSFSQKKTLTARQVGWAEMLSEFHIKWHWRPGRENVVADALSRKQEDLATAREKIQASREGRVIDPAAITRPSPEVAATYPDKSDTTYPKESSATYPDGLTATYPDFATNLSELKNPRKVQLSRPETSKRLGGTVRGPAGRTAPIETNEELRSEPEGGQHASGPSQGPPGEKLEGFDLVLELIRDNEGASTAEAGALREHAKEGHDGWSLRRGALVRHGRLWVPNEKLRTWLIEEAHARPGAAHCGANKLRKLLAARYYWKGLGSDCVRYVANCRTCRRTTVPRDKTPGLLQPLPVPDRPWQHVAADFKNFPKDSQGYDAVCVVIDRLTKRTITLPTTRDITSQGFAELYYDRVWRLYGFPETLLTDRGPQFTADFAKELGQLCGVKQKLSTAGHPQTDGQTENYNQWLDQRLRPFINHYQNDWSRWLPAMDFAQATLPHESTGISPYELELGFPARLPYDWREHEGEHGPSEPETMGARAAREYARRCHAAWAKARETLQAAQARQKKQADRKRREPDFGVGDFVYVARKGWQTDRPSPKLDLQAAGPFKILEQVGHSYRLELPAHVKIHDVLHADRLRKAPMNPLPGQDETPEPPVTIEGQEEWEVRGIRASRVFRNKLQYRADWKGYDADEAFYDAEGFKGCPHKLRQFHSQNPNAAGPPKQLEEWLQAWEDGNPVGAHPDDNAPARSPEKAKKRRHRRL